MVGILGFEGAQASHKGTVVIEMGARSSLMRLSFVMCESGMLVDGRGRFIAEVPTDIWAAEGTLLVAGGVI